MTIFRKGNSPVTLINVFDVAPEKQDELVRLLNEATTAVMVRVPGFVSANIHRSLDGKHVVNYAQWESKDHFDRMPSFAGAREHMEKAARLAQHISPSLYEVAETYDRPE
jgi:heme-degrading monooxygenase HmoA